MTKNTTRLLAGAGVVTVIAALVAFALARFSGEFTGSVPVTVLAERAGLVMNPDAKVKMRGVEVGRVASIDERPDGKAELHLEMNPGQLELIPANATVDIASSTAFGAKFVEFNAPENPSPTPLAAGAVVPADHVTVEINTVFEQLTSVLAEVEPTKLNETLGALSRGMSGRGNAFGQTLVNVDNLLATIEPALPTMQREMSTAPTVLDSYNNAANDLVQITRNATKISKSIVDKQQNLDATLKSMSTFADTGNAFVAANHQALANVMRLFLPTTGLFDRYNPALTCSLKGLADFGSQPQDPAPGGLPLSASFLWGHERYRYPGDLPKVAAKGGPRCEVLPVAFEQHPNYVVTDTGTNPFKYGNQNIILNSDGLKQLLYGPIDGPPRNTAQIGQPGR